MKRMLVLLLAGVLLLPSVNGQELPELGDIANSELSLATEKKLGQQIMHEIRWRDPAYLDDSDVESYLNQIGGRLAAASSEPGIGFYFFAVNDPTINAFAMPGGFIGVHTGLLLSAQTESELAGVLAHEVSHVTQRHIARQVFREKQLSMASMVAMGLALLAARSNSQVASAAMVTAGAGSISAQLAYSRDFEREADRAGFDTLKKSGFDVRGMSGFFARLQQAGRVYDSTAPAYLRTHPLTGERISDMQNREGSVSYRQVADSVDFHLVRARLRALGGTPEEALREMAQLVKEKKYASEAAAHYGLSVAMARVKDWEGAGKEIDFARKGKVVSAMLDRQLAEVRLGAGDIDGGLAIYREALTRYPFNHSILYGYANALIRHNRVDEALVFAEIQLRNYPLDVRLHKMRAEAYAAQGRPALQHRALAEVYAISGQTQAAIEQLELAQRAGDANFYDLSAIDARHRELKQRLAEEVREKRRQ